MYDPIVSTSKKKLCIVSLCGSKNGQFCNFFRISAKNLVFNNFFHFQEQVNFYNFPNCISCHLYQIWSNLIVAEFWVKVKLSMFHLWNVGTIPLKTRANFLMSRFDLFNQYILILNCPKLIIPLFWM